MGDWPKAKLVIIYLAFNHFGDRETTGLAFTVGILDQMEFKTSSFNIEVILLIFLFAFFYIPSKLGITFNCLSLCCLVVIFHIHIKTNSFLTRTTGCCACSEGRIWTK